VVLGYITVVSAVAVFAGATAAPVRAV